MPHIAASATAVIADGQSAVIAALHSFLAARAPRWQLPERGAGIPAVPKTSVSTFDWKTLRQQYANVELSAGHNR
jgi:fatty-acyl-CoA synthase